MNLEHWLLDHGHYWTWNNVYFPITKPRKFLCDRGIWCCKDHPRDPHSRLAIRRRLRARRVRSYSGWTQAELDKMVRP